MTVIIILTFSVIMTAIIVGALYCIYPLRIADRKEFIASFKGGFLSFFVILLTLPLGIMVGAVKWFVEPIKALIKLTKRGQ